MRTRTESSPTLSALAILPGSSRGLDRLMPAWLRKRVKAAGKLEGVHRVSWIEPACARNGQGYWHAGTQAKGGQAARHRGVMRGWSLRR
jgi:hypothetical protein